MQSNPYQPPSAELADAPSDTPPRPQTIRLACQLILASFVLSLVTLIPGVDKPSPGDADVPWIFMLTFVIVFGAITFWLTYTTYRRRNWARWALLVYLILGWFFAAEDLVSDQEHSALVGVINVAVAAMELAAAWLLFTGSGAKWFRNPKDEASAEA